MAKVAQIIPDPKAPEMYLALIEPGSCLDFVNSVPFSGPDGVIERGVLNEQGRILGRAQAAVRPISAADFNRIFSIGLAEDQLELPRPGQAINPLSLNGFSEDVKAPFMVEQERARVAHRS